MTNHESIWAATGQAVWHLKVFPRRSDLEETSIAVRRLDPAPQATAQGMSPQTEVGLDAQRVWGGTMSEEIDPTIEPVVRKSLVPSIETTVFQLIDSQMLNGIHTDREGNPCDLQGNILSEEAMRLL